MADITTPTTPENSAPVPAPEMPQQQSTPETPKKNSIAVFLIVAAAFVILLVVGILFYMKKSASPYRVGTNATVPTSAVPSATPTPDTSNAGLNADTTNIDSSMNSLNSNINAANQTVPDTTSSLTQ